MSETEAIEEAVDPPVVEEEIEIVEESEEVPEEVLEAPQEEEKEFDPKTDRVEFNEEQQAKFNDVYKQLKMSDNRNKMLTEFLQEQQKQLDEIKTRNNQTDESAAEKVLMDRISIAREEGDDQSYDAAMSELVSFKANQIVEQKVNEYQAQEQQASNTEAQYVADLMNERNETGEFKRPWLQEGHPDFNRSIEQLSGIAYKYLNDPDVLQKSLAELDQVMGVGMAPQPVQTRAPNPMQGSNLTNQKPRSKIKMTKEELHIAQKLGVDPKRYAAQRDKQRGQQ